MANGDTTTSPASSAGSGQALTTFLTAAAAVATIGVGILVARNVLQKGDGGGNGGGEIISQPWTPGPGEVPQSEAWFEAGQVTGAWIASRNQAGQNYILVGISDDQAWRGKPPGASLNAWNVALQVLSPGNFEAKFWWVEMHVQDLNQPFGQRDFWWIAGVDGLDGSAILVSLNPLSLFFP